MEFLRPNDQRARNAIAMIWIVMILEILSLISDILQYNLIQVAAGGGEVTDEDINSNDLRQLVVGIAYLGAFLISGITFIMWFRRAYFNLHQQVPYLTYSEGWAAGSWFVPIIHWFRPYKIMNELYRETSVLLQKGEYSHVPPPSPRFLGFWWALWIISNIMNQIAFRMNTDTIEQLNSMTILNIVENILSIPLALITIKIIKDYSKVEPLLSSQFPEITLHPREELEIKPGENIFKPI